MSTGTYHRDLEFYVNGKRRVVHDVDPRALLVDYLRSPAVGLTGTKKVCAQGGCGSCTVALHRWNSQAQKVETLAVNSCLRPLCSLDGMAVTTVEGVGTVETEISPVQYQMAIDNGTQCGYCTPGWVMSMHSYLVANPDKKLTQKEVEELFDGNLCRCTGFRPILYAMRHFAADWGPEDEAGSMTLLIPPGTEPKVAAAEPNTVPKGIEKPPRALYFERGGYRWYRPLTLDALLALLEEHGSVQDLRLVVGNTSIGIYGEPAQGVTFGPPYIRVDVSHIPELHGIEIGEDGLTVGAATTYTELLAALEPLLAGSYGGRLRGLEALHYMARRTAGRIVRDAASLAGNTMLVVRHVAAGTPFPSDLFTALTTLGAAVRVIRPGWPEPRLLSMLDFADLWQQDPELQAKGVILSYSIPFTGESEWTRTFKVALREVNAHSIVNGGFRIDLDPALTVRSATAVLGGIGPVAFHLASLETWLVGRSWSAETLALGLTRIREGVLERLAATRERMRDVPEEGFTDEYKTHLAESYFYQFFVWVAAGVEPSIVPPGVRSAGERPERPVSRGTQTIQTYQSEFPVSFPFVKTEAFLQVTGGTKYTHDEPPPQGGLEGALVLSTNPLATFSFAVPGDGGARKVAAAELAEHLRGRFPGFFDLVTAADIPGTYSLSWAGPPDPLLVPEGSQVTACGQALATVLAWEEQQAIDIAWWVQTHCVVYDDPQTPILTLQESIAQKNFVLDAGNIRAIVRPGSKFAWLETGEEAIIDGVHCRVVRGSQESRSPQIHFYMETQAALAVPGEKDAISVISSTQNPNTVLGSILSALSLPSNQVEVLIRRLGGGYGGKGPRTPLAAANAAVAAAAHRRPVRIAFNREVDTALFGHSNPLLGDYAAAIGTGQDNPDNRGRLMGLSTKFFLNAGNTLDCSSVVLDCVQLRADNGYLIPNYRTSGEVCITQTTSNTSFRSLEAINGIILQEDALEAAAHAIGILPETVRERNLYSTGDFTAYEEELDYCYLREVWSFTKGTWKTSSDPGTFDQRLAAIRAFNAANRWRKRGISMIPVKYGMGFNLASMEWGDALVEIYDKDGTVLVHHGGVEMGQGIDTQIIQLVSQALNIPQEFIQVGTTSTGVIPNPESTGASTGTAYNGGAAQRAAQILRLRLESFCSQMLNQNGRAYCETNNIDYWNYDEGWRAMGTSNGKPALVWASVIALAYTNRVDLSVQAHHNETGGGVADSGLRFWNPKKPETVQNFIGYTYSAGISEVELDVLTGEVTILRSDLAYDMGKSLNPATDVGQIEGAFLQGVGRVLTEEIVWQDREPGLGTNNTPNTWGYKIPATTTVPLELNVNLYPRDDSAMVQENPNLLMSAKESGEPPLCLAATVYFAVKHAILAARQDRGDDGWFRLDMPCTVQRVREACKVEVGDLTL
jgi:xanthine dehydrogenase/oxidase